MPCKNKNHKRSAIRALQVSHDKKSIAIGPLRSEGAGREVSLGAPDSESGTRGKNTGHHERHGKGHNRGHYKDHYKG